MDKENSYNERIDKLYNRFMQMNYGDIIYHNEIEKILGISRELNKYSIYVKKVKDLAVLKSRVFKSIPGLGLQLLKPQQVSSFTYRKYINRTLNLYNYSTFILENLNTDNFSDDRTEEYNNVVELNSKLKDITTKNIRESHYYNRRAYYESLED